MTKLRTFFQNFAKAPNCCIFSSVFFIDLIMEIKVTGLISRSFTSIGHDYFSFLVNRFCGLWVLLLLFIPLWVSLQTASRRTEQFNELYSGALDVTRLSRRSQIASDTKRHKHKHMKLNWNSLEPHVAMIFFVQLNTYCCPILIYRGNSLINL